MKIFCEFPTVNISKLIFLLAIRIVKNFIWTTLKAIFSIFRFFPNVQLYSCISAKYRSIITNHTPIRFQIMYKSKFKKIDPYDWFRGLVSYIVWQNTTRSLKNINPYNNNLYSKAFVKMIKFIILIYQVNHLTSQIFFVLSHIQTFHITIRHVTSQNTITHIFLTINDITST